MDKVGHVAVTRGGGSKNRSTEQTLRISQLGISHELKLSFYKNLILYSTKYIQTYLHKMVKKTRNIN